MKIWNWFKKKEESQLVSYAKKELARAGLLDKDSDYKGELGKSVLRLIEIFSKEGHSGFSANYAAEIFNRLSRFHPLTPLTGEDNEWMDISDGENFLQQNMRCSSVFRTKTATYDVDAPFKKDSSGSNILSNITFPYYPDGAKS